jgi:TRAP-type mannitol/chloroaromatic compound transport system substrate-binding protein
MMARYDSLNPNALRRLIASGTQLRFFPREVLMACYRETQEFYAEKAASNPRFGRIHRGWEAFRRDQTQWFRLAEDSMANFLAFASQQR